MELSLLTAISPIDGRYRSKTEPLAEYFSEYALIRYRVRVEIEYFITLCELPLPQLQDINHSQFDQLRDIYRQFTPADAQRVKDIEKVTNHDVKAVEYFIKERLDAMGGYEQYKEFIHFGLTSQDINNTSVPLSVKESLEQVYYPMLQELINQLTAYAEEWKDVPMLAKTHGQPASPTRLGKEVMVFVYRLQRQLEMLRQCPVTAKFGGAEVFMKPAAPGTGVKAGGAMRAVFESVGIHDVLAKSKGSSNPHNLVKATIAALAQMRDAYTVAGLRGVPMKNVFNG